jgi:Histidine kinase-, DNA gyrase B-, and HSP90-like ATPase
MTHDSTGPERRQAESVLPDNSSGGAPSGESLNWAPDAPRGGRAVMNRILKEKATVPLFFAQTLISSLRDVGYNHTTSALCEHVDNAIEAGASEIRVFVRQTGKKGQYETDAAVYDDGSGMGPNTLKVATSFGGSLSYNNRTGIGRFGMGMKTAALSMSPVMELYSWQEPGAYYNMTLDVAEVGKDRSNLVELPDPTLMTELPDEISTLFTEPMSWPERDEQQVFSSAAELPARLGKSGTIVYMPSCDRLTFAKARTLCEHAVKEMSRIYRRTIGNGLKLYVNNRIVEAFDPTYYMANARHARYIEGDAKQSRLILAKPVQVSLAENSAKTAPITIRLYKLPIDQWSALPRKTLKNDLRVFDGLTVSILRNDREVYAGELPELTTHHSVTHWYRVQIEFPGVLDEAFGVAANKQGVRMKEFVMKAIKEAVGDDITTINDEIKRFQAAQASAREASKPSASEARATEADAFQPKVLEDDLSEEESQQLDANLRALAVGLRRDNETDEEAFQRVKNSKYVIAFKYDEYWPFYHVEHRFGRVILTINTAHGFFAQLYDPLQKLLKTQLPESEGETAKIPQAEPAMGPLVALELLLLSLARSQSVLSQNNDDARKILDALRRDWSEAYRVQLGS